MNRNPDFRIGAGPVARCRIAVSEVRQEAQRRRISRSRPDLARALDQVNPFTMLALRKRVTLHDLGRHVLEAGLPGDVAEMGVHRGGGLGILAPHAIAAGRTVHLFDRWGDLPDAGEGEGDLREWVDASNDEARAAVRRRDPLASVESLYFDVLGLPRERVRLRQGWFDETFPAYDGGSLAFVHLDADFYESTVVALGFLDEHLADDAIVVLDDWGTWPGVRTAYEEFAVNTKRDLRLHPGRAQAVVVVGDVELPPSLASGT